jgi:cholesterol transport system auxiliary component
MKIRYLIPALVLLGGCNGGILAPPGEAPALYTLNAPEAPSSGTPVSWQLLIDQPKAPLDLDSARIAIIPAPYRLDYFANVIWADRVPAMLQALLLESFEKSGRIAAVQRQSGGLRDDFALSTDIEHFEVNAAQGAPAVHIGLTARLVRSRDRSIVATQAFEATAPTGSGFAGVVPAFDAALRDLLPKIVDWSLDAGSRNP